MGIANGSWNPIGNYLGNDANSWGWVASTGDKITGDNAVSYGTTASDGDVLGVALDMDSGTIKFFRNNTDLGTAYTGLTGTMYAALGNSNANYTITANFGSTPFTYAPPAGYNSGLYDIPASGPIVISTANNAITLAGDFTNTGTALDAGSSAITLSGTSTQSIAGFTTTGTLTSTKTGGTATLQSAVSAGALTVNGSGGTLDLGTGLTHTISGTVTLTQGTLSGNTSNISMASFSSSNTNTRTLNLGSGTWTVTSQAGGASTIANINPYWKLDETSGNAIDSVALYTGTKNGTVTQNVSGKINTAYTFNGSTGYLNAGAIFSSSVFSYSAWVKTSAGATQGVISPTDNYNTVPYFRVNNDYHVELVERGIGTIGLSTGTITPGSWNHIAVTYDASGNWVIYINGSPSGSGTYLTSFTFDNLIIGAQGNGPTEFFNGRIDEVGIWNRALTSGEISQLYNGGSGLAYLTSGGTTWDVGTSTGLTVNGGTSTIKFTDSSSTGKTFSGGGKTYNNFWFAPGAGTGSLTIVGDNTFNNFKDDGSISHSILFTAGSAQHFNNWNVIGSSGNLITINSTTTGVHYLFRDGSSSMNSDYLNIQHSVASPQGAWFAGINSTNNQLVTSAGGGWIFSIERLFRGSGGSAGGESVNGGSGNQGGGSSSTATGTVVLSSGSVSSVTIASGGSGYISAPIVSFCGGGGSGASGTAVLTNGVVTSVNINSGGSGYNSSITVLFGSNCPSGGGGGGGDLGTIKIDKYFAYFKYILNPVLTSLFNIFT